MSEEKSSDKEAARGLRKERVGVVSSDKMNKTIVVDVVRRVPHAKFRKIVKLTTKLYAHDEKSEAKIGDKVRITETKPMSKKKCWRLVEVLSH
ncbi:MAG: 30S ribosomal protein S17 [Verrucomicrobiales bacterium]|nr:30S ribosomal protein S17 [Verrucomicrobiales bacterium]MEC9035618.1 30S ribosomal protein S17 [Verrucomicrobiota bacterium]|tara:strand:+ start:1425 stop:1703 length:279 start_codon:yes stop_codon:yes gene_type:complete